MPYFWVIATILSISGNSRGPGGEDSPVAGSPASSMNFSSPAGVLITRPWRAYLRRHRAYGGAPSVRQKLQHPV